MRFAPFTLVALLLACSSGTDSICDPCTTSATVHGTVTTTAGQPMAGAEVDVDVYRESCSGTEVTYFNAATGSPGTVFTSATGAYEIRLRSPASPFTACLTVEVRPAPAAAPVTAATGVTVRFAADSPSPSTTRARVDVAIPDAAVR